MGYNLLDAYDDARAGNNHATFTQYCGETIAVCANDGEVGVGVVSDSDAEHWFNVHHREPHEFLEDVSEFLNSSA